MKTRKHWVKILILIVMIVSLNFYLSKNYSVIAPGITVDLKNVVDVENGLKNEKGSFFLTTVSSRSLNIPIYLYSKINPYIEIEKRGNMIPPGWSIEEYSEYMQRWMKESQKIAEVVALRKAGYDTKIHGEGAQVVEVMQESPARGKLLPGDVIKSIDGKEISIADEVVKTVSNRNIGETLTLEIIRDSKPTKVSVDTIESESEKGKAVIGVYITTLNWNPILPLEVQINTENIGGPSAGSMFAMEILNQLTDKDLTCGKKIAGTGTISLDGHIGEIGGVKQKVVAAYRDGAEIFFVPEKNARDARKAAEDLDIKVVSVKQLDDILDYLVGSKNITLLEKSWAPCLQLGFI